MWLGIHAILTIKWYLGLSENRGFMPNTNTGILMWNMLINHKTIVWRGCTVEWGYVYIHTYYHTYIYIIHIYNIHIIIYMYNIYIYICIHMMGCNGISQTVWYGIAVVSLQNTLFSWHFNWKNDDKPRKHGMLNQKWWFVGGYINWGKLGWVAIETNNVQLVEGTISWILEF